MNVLNKKTLLISDSAPPKVGGPQSIYEIFSFIDSNSYVMLTSYCNIPKNNEPVGDWLKCKYYFFDINNDIPKDK
jgi:hypothetical protein